MSWLIDWLIDWVKKSRSHSEINCWHQGISSLILLRHWLLPSAQSQGLYLVVAPSHLHSPHPQHLYQALSAVTQSRRRRRRKGRRGSRLAQSGGPGHGRTLGLLCPGCWSEGGFELTVEIRSPLDSRHWVGSVGVQLEGEKKSFQVCSLARTSLSPRRQLGFCAKIALTVHTGASIGWRSLHMSREREEKWYHQIVTWQSCDGLGIMRHRDLRMRLGVYDELLCHVGPHCR